MQKHTHEKIIAERILTDDQRREDRNEEGGRGEEGYLWCCVQVGFFFFGFVCWQLIETDFFL